MLLLYSLLLTLAFILMSPLFLLRRQKYAAGFRQRLGNYPEFKHDGRKVIWLHCVSVGETNAARPLVDQLKADFPAHRIVISTTTLTGQYLARSIFNDKADAVFYFPFDWKFSVRKALANYKPSLVLLMETEIWPQFIREAKKSGAKIVIVNGRLSEKSLRKYSIIRGFVSTVLEDVDLALMQAEKDGERIKQLGISDAKVAVTGNLKFEQGTSVGETELSKAFRSRFAISGEKPLIIAASTHAPEERLVIDSLDGELGYSCRLMIAPRHPERFERVAELIIKSPYTFVRRTDAPSEKDPEANIILLDTIGELRDAYPLAEIVFVGGSLIPHGGQSVIEPAANGKAIVTGPFTQNFEAVMQEFHEHKAIRQTPIAPDDSQISERLYEEFTELLESQEIRQKLGRNAAGVMGHSDRSAISQTIEAIRSIA